jgi:RNA polymerase sigma factor (sigma-70 family)
MTELLQHDIETTASPVHAPVAMPPSDSFLRGLTSDERAVLTKLLTSGSDYVDHPEFTRKGIERQLFGSEARFAAGPGIRFVDPPSAYGGEPGRGGVPALTHSQEALLFMRYNYARRACALILEESAGKRLTAPLAKRLIAWAQRALDVRATIVEVNLPLVLAMGKRTRLSNVDFNELVSEGNMALLRSVEKFDCARGYKFSTYSCRAILKSFSRVAMRASRYRGRFPAEFDPAMEKSAYAEERRDDVERDCVDELKEILIKNLAELSEVERRVINERFAISNNPAAEASPKTLEEVGSIIGVTKERVRQIQNKALRKIKSMLEARYLAA